MCSRELWGGLGGPRPPGLHVLGSAPALVHHRPRQHTLEEGGVRLGRPLRACTQPPGGEDAWGAQPLSSCRLPGNVPSMPSHQPQPHPFPRHFAF